MYKKIVVPAGNLLKLKMKMSAYFYDLDSPSSVG